MMNEKVVRHFWYYLSFITVELSGLGLILLFSHEKYIQFLIVCFMAIFYIGWSILHHYHHHDITAKIVVEYILIGLLGVVISFFIFQQV